MKKYKPIIIVFACVIAVFILLGTIISINVTRRKITSSEESSRISERYSNVYNSEDSKITPKIEVPKYDTHEDYLMFEEESTVIETTEEPTEAPKPTAPPEKLLFQSNDITIYYTGHETDPLYYGLEKTLNVRIENHSNYDYAVHVRNESINGYMISMFLSCTVSAGKIANTNIYIMNEDLMKNNITEINSVEMSFYFINRNDYSLGFETEKIQWTI